MSFATGWAKKFTDTLSDTIDSVKTYGSNVQGGKLVIPVPGLGKQANGTTPTDGRPSTGEAPKSPSAGANRSFFGIPNKNLLTEGSPIKNLMETSPVKSPGAQDKEKSPAKEPLIDSYDGVGFEPEFGRERTLSNVSLDREINGDAHDQGYQNTKIEEEPELDLFDLEEFGVPMQSYVTEKKMDKSQGGAKAEMDATSTTMDQARAAEEKAEKKPNKCLAAIKRILQDNRMPDGDSEALMQTGEGHEMLKRVLNIMFLVIGISLFLAVVVVVIYAVIVESQQEE